MTNEERILSNEEEEGLEVPGFAEEKDCIQENELDCSGDHRMGCTNPCTSCDRFVRFCCETVIPKNFPLDPTQFEKRSMVYDTSCLACIVTECELDVKLPSCPGVCAPAYEVRVRGAIPFIANAEFVATDRCGGIFNQDGSPNSFHQDRIFNVCCPGCVCVDNVLCIKTSKSEAEDICNELNNNGFVCLDEGSSTNSVGANLFVETEDCEMNSTNCTDLSGNKVVRFCGSFELPVCNC